MVSRDSYRSPRHASVDLPARRPPYATTSTTRYVRCDCGLTFLRDHNSDFDFLSGAVAQSKSALKAESTGQPAWDNRGATLHDPPERSSQARSTSSAAISWEPVETYTGKFLPVPLTEGDPFVNTTSASYPTSTVAQAEIQRTGRGEVLSHLSKEEKEDRRRRQRKEWNKTPAGKESLKEAGRAYKKAHREAINKRKRDTYWPRAHTPPSRR